MDVDRGLNLTASSMVPIVQRLTSSRSVWIGYSGGVDSHVLLDLIVKGFQSLPEYEIRAIHIHHGLHRDADQWVKHCQSVCQKLNVPLAVYRVDARAKTGESPEAAAREARYQIFHQVLQSQDALLLAHHAQDQAETILLRLLRGSGPLGLGGIRAHSRVGKLEIVRPLLDLSKEDIQAYANKEGLRWIEDTSNEDERFDRNFLRKQIMPALLARWPQGVRSINRGGQLCLETALAAQRQAVEDLETVQESGGLNVKSLLELDPFRRREVVRVWLLEGGFQLPSQDHLERILREILQARKGALPRLKIGHYELRREGNTLKIECLKSMFDD